MTGVILNPDMTYLDPDTSTFTTMLMKMTGGYRKMVSAGHLRKGDFVNESGGQWYVSAIVRKNADDWFSDEKLAVLTKPWMEVEPPLRTSFKVSWLEDQLFWGKR
jgi:hypothetical protein